MLNSGSCPLGDEPGTIQCERTVFWTRVHVRKEQKMSALLSLPAIDGVEITTIMDNALDLMMASTPVAKRFPVHRELFSPHQLRAEHGVSLLVTALNEGKRETILFDTGVTPDGALHNLALLGVDLGSIQAIVLSHGHTDHTQGLDGFLDKLGKRHLPILLHPDAFLKRRLVVNDQVSIDLPPPSLHDLEREGIELLVERGPSFLINGRNKGLVVITGCGHAGVINILHQVRSQTGVEQIYTVLGGFHLTGALFEPIIPQTVEALRQFNPAVVVPAHCTGWRATQRIAQALPEAYTPNSVGTTFKLMAP